MRKKIERPEVKVLKIQAMNVIATSDTPQQAKGVSLGSLGYANGGESILFPNSLQ